jgi:methyl-accepting chemotaxis protein
MWRSFSIAKKICASVILIALGYMTAMAFVISLGARSQERLSEVESALFPAAQQSQTALMAFEQQVKSYGDAVIIGDAKGLDLARVKGVAAQDALASLVRKGGLSPELTNAAQNCLRNLNEYSDEAIPIYSSMTNGKMDQMDKAVALGKKAEILKGALEELSKKLSSDLRSEISLVKKASQSQATVSVIALLWVLATSGLLIYVTTVIIRPLRMITKVANQISLGDVNQAVNYESGDEVGMLAQAFRELISYIKSIAQAADDLSRGDVNVHVAVRSEQDLLSQSFKRVADSLSRINLETARLTKAAADGRLEIRGEAAKFQGAYADIIMGFNKTLDLFVEPINEAATVLDQMSRKDLTGRMAGSYRGDFARIKEGLNRALENLEISLQQAALGSQQVTTAARQISSGSQTLAHDASSQASALEEVSSSLQETGTMSQTNASNAQQTHSMAEQARKDTAQGMENMKKLSDAIKKIKNSADQSAKIIKTINEIAFQTNLLALNAAVEAARAGDAGRGFAVVAEEVRNLAMRSADAATNTSELIEQSVKNSEEGFELNQEVLENLNLINQRVNKVGEVIAEIASASDQQRTGLDQINKSVQHMNSLTQQVAANAEESASAAEELSGQAAEMQSMIASFKLSSSVHSSKRVSSTMVNGGVQPHTSDSSYFEQANRE